METATTAHQSLILKDAIDLYPSNPYDAEQLEVGQGRVLPDGNVAYRVTVFRADDDFPRTEEIEDESYWATVVDGKVYGNVEFADLTAECTA